MNFWQMGKNAKEPHHQDSCNVIKTIVHAAGALKHMKDQAPHTTQMYLASSMLDHDKYKDKVKKVSYQMGLMPTEHPQGNNMRRV